MLRSCLLLLSISAAVWPADLVTFNKEVLPILQKNCQTCHRPGEIGPMAFLTYEGTRPWAKSMRERVITRNMPPWHLDQTVGIQQFQNDRSLTEAQIATIVGWVDGGAPLGNPKDMPPPKQWPEEEGWQLARLYGQPDLVLKSEPYTMPAHARTRGSSPSPKSRLRNRDGYGRWRCDPAARPVARSRITCWPD